MSNFTVKERLKVKMDKSKKIIILSTIVLAGFFFAVVYHYVLGFYLNLGDNYNSLVWPSDGAFCDFKNTLYHVRDFIPYELSSKLWVVYFPLSYIIMLFPFIFVKGWFSGYLFFVLLLLAFLLYSNKKYLYCENLNKLQNIKNIFILSFISYPVLYSLDKGNFDMFLFVVLGLCVFAFNKEKYILSSVLLAVVNACKPFTLLFLLLFLIRRKYKEFFLSLFITGILIIGGFLFFSQDLSGQFNILRDTWVRFKVIYAFSDLEEVGMRFGSSIFMTLKLIFCRLTAQPIISTIAFTKIYDIACYFITAITMFFVWKEKIFWKQLTLLTCNFLLLPYITYDYKLIFLYIPVWFFISEKEKTKFDLIYVILFGLLFIPKNIIINVVQTGPTVVEWFSLSIIINPILMIILTCLIIYEQLKIKANIKNG